jgi:molybdenum cofactor cytidylyltransferase
VRLVVLLLAAGGSTRMRGGDKLTEDVGGIPLLRRQALAALAACPEVIVVLPPDRPARVAALKGVGVQTVIAHDARDGMSASLRAGLRAAVGDAAMVLPADMPELGPAELRAMAEAFRETPDRILRGASGDTPGHPVIFPADLWPNLMQMTGDQGGREVIAAHRDRVRLIPLPGRAALTDLDTPEDWATWRAQP